MLVQLLERLGARYVADVAPSGGRHIYALFAASLPWRELRDVCRAFSRGFPAIDPAPMPTLAVRSARLGTQAQERRLAAPVRDLAGGRRRRPLSTPTGPRYGTSC